MDLSRQESNLTSGRANQKQRTRQAIVDAAIRFAREGRQLTIAEVAEAAGVSTPTAYRYFPNPQSLRAELQFKTTLTVAEILDGAPEDPADRMDFVVSRVADFQLADEAFWRSVLQASLERWFSQAGTPEAERVPTRGDRRLTMTREALGGLQDTLPPELYRRLTMAMVMVFGVEGMLSTRDGCALDPDEAKEVMRWAAQALIRAALQEAQG